uniref:AC4 n=1 Tax=Euphorbia leaf curl virus TaxID=270117 RepID=B8Y665_9GEMI|nr:AC4 [Euphorbia leaf curl virus]
MGTLISTCLCNSKANTTARITDSSTWFPPTDQHISIRTFRELSPAPMSSPTSIRMETPLNGANSRSTEEVLGEAARMLTTHVQRL